MNEVVSVIVPIYNVEEWVKKTVSSIVEQTYKKLEIILVDDESKDLSGKIVDKLATKDERIVVVHKPNGGLADARNAGLRIATGKYVLFVDGDDWLDADAIQTLVAIQQKQQAEVVLFPYAREFENTTRYTKLMDGGSQVLTGNRFFDIYRRMIGPVKAEMNSITALERLSTAWGKLYIRDLIKSEFKGYEENYPEDLFFNVQNLRNIKRAYYTEDVWYRYNKLNQSAATKSVDVFYKYKGNNRLMELIQTFIAEDNDDLRIALNNRSLLRMLNFSLAITSSKESKTNKKLALKELLSDVPTYVDVTLAKKQTAHLNLPLKTFFNAVLKQNHHIVYLYANGINALRNIR